jgi:hypothetical protein
LLLQGFKISDELSDRLIIPLMQQFDFLIYRRDSELGRTDLLSQKVAEGLSDRRRLFDFV